MTHRAFSPYVMPDVDPTIALARTYMEDARRERSAYVCAGLTRIATFLKSAFSLRTPKPVRAPAIG
jgi:hypothetical protein